MQMMLVFLPLVFLAGISLLLSVVGGWARLTTAYRGNQMKLGQQWRWQSGTMARGVSYRSCLFVGANEHGLQLSVWFPFRLGHPSLFIPWEEITFVRPTAQGPTRLSLQFSRVPEIRLTVSKELGKQLQNSSDDAGSPVRKQTRQVVENQMMKETRPSTRPLYQLSLIWIIAALLTTFGVAMGTGFPKLNQLANSATKIVGKVETLQPENHDLMIYTFEVNGRVYKKETTTNGVRYGLGDKIEVFYDPTDPNLSVIGDPIAQRNSVLVMSSVIGVLLATLILVALRRRRTPRNNQG